MSRAATAKLLDLHHSTKIAWKLWTFLQAGKRPAEQRVQPETDIELQCSKVRLAVIGPLKCCVPLPMAALGKLRRGIVGAGQCPVWAVRVDGVTDAYFNLAQNDVLRS